jgi:TIR domain
VPNAPNPCGQSATFARQYEPPAAFGFAIILRGSREYAHSVAAEIRELRSESRMASVPKKIFISYVQEDGAVAYEIAAGLETQGYSSWYYERDCPAGADYFEETHKAISDCEAMVIVISPRSLPSDQITREIVRAVESSKATFPLLLEVTHDDYAHRRPGWHQAMAAANATRIPPERVATVVPSLVAGLGAKGIQAHANGRWASAEPPKQTTTVPQAVLNGQLSPTRAAAIVAKPATGVHIPTVATAAPSSAAATGGAKQQPPWTIIGIGIAAAAVVVGFIGWKSLHHPPAPAPPPTITTATVMIRYASDRHKCTPDLNVTIAGKAFHPTSNAFAASGVKSGAQEYTIDGLISCPGRKAIQASGSGAIDIHEGAVFDLAWQTNKSAGTSNVDLIRVTDDSAPPVANDDKGGHESQNQAQSNVQRTVTPAPAPTPAPVPVSEQAAAGQPQLQNAQTAYAQGRYFAPLNNSALFWAIQARNAGNQNGRALELQIDNIYKTQVTQLYQQRNYPAASQLVDVMLSYYPGEPGLLRDKQMIVAAANGAGGPNQAPFNVQMPHPQYPPGAMPPPRPMPHP